MQRLLDHAARRVLRPAREGRWRSRRRPSGSAGRELRLLQRGHRPRPGRRAGRRARAHARAPGPALGSADGRRSPRSASNTDRLLARRALLEGDATWASFATVTGGTLDDGHARTRARPDGRRCPRPARQRPCRTCRRSCATPSPSSTTTARSSWTGCWRAAAGPRSTARRPTRRRRREQVLHPERYLATRRDVPTRGRGDRHAERSSGDGFTLVAQRHAGRGGHPHARQRGAAARREAARVADGWDGDRLVAFARGDGPGRRLDDGLGHRAPTPSSSPDAVPTHGVPAPSSSAAGRACWCCSGACASRAAGTASGPVTASR